MQLTSPKLNYLIIAGSLLMYCSVFIQLLHTTDKTTVHVQCIVSTTMYILEYACASLPRASAQAMRAPYADAYAGVGGACMAHVCCERICITSEKNFFVLETCCLLWLLGLINCNYMSQESIMCNAHMHWPQVVNLTTVLYVTTFL